MDEIQLFRGRSQTPWPYEHGDESLGSVKTKNSTQRRLRER